MAIKILWLSNVDLTYDKPSKSGTWIYSIFNALKKNNEVLICANITFSTCKKEMVDLDGFHQYYLPLNYLYNDGTPQSVANDYVVNIINKENPDIIHVWGTERCWASFALDNRLFSKKKLLEIQGLICTLCDDHVFYGGLSKCDIYKNYGLIELIYKQNRLTTIQKKFRKWSNIEHRYIISFKHIDVQSSWIETMINQMSSNANIHPTGIILRDSFLTCQEWYKVHKQSNYKTIFTITSGSPYKGLHVTLRALSVLKKKYPDIKLRIAGLNKSTSKSKTLCYSRYLSKLIDTLDISENVEFLGNMDEFQLLEEMYMADAFVLSSFVESFCLALAEALSAGIPCVASYVAALPELIRDGIDGYLYPVGDYNICADRLMKILENSVNSYSFSRLSTVKMREICSLDNVCRKQISTYKSIYNEIP